MQQKFYTILFSLLLFVAGSLSAQNVLFIAKDNPAIGNDIALNDALVEMGYNVTAISAAELTVTAHLDYEADVIVFGEALSSSAVVPFADAGFPVPCVSLEGYCARSNRWNLLASDDDFGQVRVDETYGIAPKVPEHYSIDVVGDHPIFKAAGFGPGDNVVWSTEPGDGELLQPEVVWMTQMPQTTAKAVADIGGEADLHTFWTLEPDANDATNPLNHRLVIWGVHDNGLGAMTNDFKTLIDNSIKWVLDELVVNGNGEKVLYIARNNPPDGNDPVMVNGLIDLGYNVTAISAAELTVTAHLDYEAEVIFFGEYLSSSAVVPFADAGFPTPCVSLEGYCPRSNRWNLLASDDDFGQIRVDESYGIAPKIPDHYSVKVIEDNIIFSNAGFGVGDEFAWSTETGDGELLQPEVVWMTSFPQATAKALADISGEEDLHTYWTFEPDAADATNPLNHRLVIWGVHDNGFAQATDDYWAIIDNSVQWVLGKLVSNNKEVEILEAGLSNSPNPFKESTMISFDLKTSANVNLNVYDALGQLVAKQNAQLTSGEQQLQFVNNGLQTGVYYYSLFADGKFAGTGKMVIE